MFSTILLTIWTCGVVFDHMGVAEMIVEIVLVVFFALVSLLQMQGFRACLGFKSYFFLRGRPALVLWCVFELVAHGCFAIIYGLRDLANSEVGWCLYVSGDALYYLVYPYVLIFVVRMDSRYWKQSGALLNDMRTVLEQEEEEGVLSIGNNKEIDAVGDFPLIPWSQLEFKEKIGSGGFSVVYKATWKGACKCL